MKLLKLKMDGLPNFKGALDIDFVAWQRVDAEDQEKLYHVFSNIYVNQIISFIGINASGKTTILKGISLALQMLNNDAINTIDAREILNDLGKNQEVIITAYFYNNGMICKLETCIRKKINQLDGSYRFVICNEKLWKKQADKVKTKKSLLDFTASNLVVQRSQNEQYLLEDVSIIVAENKENNSGLSLYDMSRFTNHNMLNILGRFPEELLIFLDPGIEYLRCKVDDKFPDIRLKFLGKEELVLNSPLALENYLSSGTIKGLSVFMNAVFAFNEGGYLLVDELENHFNREIVATLLRFFMNHSVNKEGGTLIFSTHYSELLDEFDRNDSIYIVRNRSGITAENLTNILNRNDIKKSEAYDSDFLEGTVPAYESYMALKKVLMSIRKIRED